MIGTSKIDKILFGKTNNINRAYYGTSNLPVFETAGLYSDDDELIYSYSELMTMYPSLSFEDAVLQIFDDNYSTCNTSPAADTLVGKFVLPSSIKYLGPSAFCYCSGLTEIVLPEKLKYIGAYAFHGCTNLTKFNLADTSVEFIGQYALEYTGIKKIIYPNTVKVAPILSYDLYSSRKDDSSGIILSDNIEAFLTFDYYSTGLIDLSSYLSSAKPYGVTYEDGMYYIGSNTNPYFLLVKLDSDLESKTSGNIVINNRCKFIYKNAISGRGYIKLPDSFEKFVTGCSTYTLSSGQFQNLNYYNYGYYFGTSSNPYKSLICVDSSVSSSSTLTLHKDIENILCNIEAKKVIYTGNNLKFIGAYGLKNVEDLAEFSFNSVEIIDQYGLYKLSSITPLVLTNCKYVASQSVYYSKFSSVVATHLEQPLTFYTFYELRCCNEFYIDGPLILGYYTCSNVMADYVKIGDSIKYIDSPYSLYDLYNLATLYIGKKVKVLSGFAYAGGPKYNLTVSQENKYFSDSGNCISNKKTGELILAGFNAVTPNFVTKIVGRYRFCYYSSPTFTISAEVCDFNPEQDCSCYIGEIINNSSINNDTVRSKFSHVLAVTTGVSKTAIIDGNYLINVERDDGTASKYLTGLIPELVSAEVVNIVDGVTHIHTYALTSSTICYGGSGPTAPKYIVFPPTIIDVDFSPYKDSVVPTYRFNIVASKNIIFDNVFGSICSHSSTEIRSSITSDYIRYDLALAECADESTTDLTLPLNCEYLDSNISIVYPNLTKVRFLSRPNLLDSDWANNYNLTSMGADEKYDIVLPTLADDYSMSGLIPSTVTLIDYTKVFKNLTTITSSLVPKNIEQILLPQSLTEISSSAFASSNIKTIDLTNTNIKHIWDDAFRYSKLATLLLGDKCPIIDHFALYGTALSKSYYDGIYYCTDDSSCQHKIMVNSDTWSNKTLRPECKIANVSSQSTYGSGWYWYNQYITFPADSQLESLSVSQYYYGKLHLYFNDDAQLQHWILENIIGDKCYGLCNTNRNNYLYYYVKNSAGSYISYTPKQVVVPDSVKILNSKVISPKLASSLVINNTVNKIYDDCIFADGGKLNVVYFNGTLSQFKQKFDNQSLFDYFMTHVSELYTKDSKNNYIKY